ncbi:hypothetical protein WSM22_17210 [Cytophagales bacterium WSM2-2]|nr:hypothetical protein WSM22_17210 [Cytophagales bacterium WSM2-2]
MLAYTFYEEAPLVKKYFETDNARIALLMAYKEQGRKEPVFLDPLFNPEYNSIPDMFRSLTHTDIFPSLIPDMPVCIGEIKDHADWRNGHLKFGLGLQFDIFLLVEPSVRKSK